jgi:hypothetical protein
LAAVGAAGDFADAAADQRQPGLALVKTALRDEDPAVRARAEALVAKLLPPEAAQAAPAAPAPTAPAPAVAAPPDLAPPPPDLLPPPPDLAQPPPPTAAELGQQEGQLAMTSGELALKTGKLDVALRELSRAHRIDPKLPVAFSLGETYRKMGDRETDAAKQRDLYSKAVSFYAKAHDKRAASYAAELSERIKH